MKNKEITQRKTKILATLGPSSNTIKKIIFSLKYLIEINFEMYIENGINIINAIRLKPPYLRLGWL